MFKMFGAAVAAVALVAANPAGAVQFYQMTLTGTLVSELGLSGPQNTGIDPILKVGDALTLTARISEDRYREWGAHGFSQAGVYGLGITGDEFWRIDGPGGLVWSSRMDMYDGALEFFWDQSRDGKSMVGPGMGFADGQVLGVSGYLVPTNSTVPILSLGSAMASGVNECRPDCTASYSDNANWSDTFKILPGDALYGNRYNSQGFLGVWDFENSSAVSAVPEPATWATMIVGFALAGTMVRRRRVQPAFA